MIKYLHADQNVSRRIQAENVGFSTIKCNDANKVPNKVLKR